MDVLQNYRNCTMFKLFKLKLCDVLQKSAFITHWTAHYYCCLKTNIFQFMLTNEPPSNSFMYYIRVNIQQEKHDCSDFYVVKVLTSLHSFFIWLSPSYLILYGRRNTSFSLEQQAFFSSAHLSHACMQGREGASSFPYVLTLALSLPLDSNYHLNYHLLHKIKYRGLTSKTPLVIL